MKRNEIEDGAVLLHHPSNSRIDWDARPGLGRPVTVVDTRPHAYEEKTVTRSTGQWSRHKVPVPTDKSDGVLVREFPDDAPIIVRLRDLHGDYDSCCETQVTRANENAVQESAKADADAFARRVRDEVVARAIALPGASPYDARTTYGTGFTVEIDARLLLAILDALPAGFICHLPDSGR